MRLQPSEHLLILPIWAVGLRRLSGFGGEPLHVLDLSTHYGLSRAAKCLAANFDAASGPQDSSQPILTTEVANPRKLAFIIGHQRVAKRQGLCGDEEVVGADRFAGPL
jgi:hypothetical protein